MDRFRAPSSRLVGRLVSLLASGLALAAAAPAAAQLPEDWGRLCDTEEARRFDFMIGTWDGLEYRVRGGDTIAVGRRESTIESVLGGCGLLERLRVWEGGEPTLQAILLRSLDRRSGAWVVTRLDDGPTQRTYESTEGDGTLYFASSYPEDGTIVHIRLGWRPREGGFRQTIHESRTDTASWILTEYVDFVRRER